MKNRFLNLLLMGSIVSSVMFVSCSKEEDDAPTTPTTVTDVDGNVYKTVTIGEQTWMAENLKVTNEPDGTEIPHVSNDTAWSILEITDKACCYYDNSAANGDTYGVLYTYEAAKNACPDGWHIPTPEEWNELKDYLRSNGHFASEGTALKATTDWGNDANGTDDYSFCGLPGGDRFGYEGTFHDIGKSILWWSSSEYSDTEMWVYGLSNATQISTGGDHMTNGNYVRCIKD